VELRDWIGRTQAAEDVIRAWPARALAAALDWERGEFADGDALPPLWHWMYFLEAPRASELGPDGHARRGGFLPPVALPRRMWAGGRFVFEEGLRIGEAAERVSRIEDVREKQGRSGPLVFVVVRHEVRTARGLALSEEHDIVYRGLEQAGAPARAQEPFGEAAWSQTVRPDAVLLFRYSALTFNGHRIHYDQQYCVEQEGYPGLVVHGPLLATLLLELLRRQAPEAAIRTFEFRAVGPAFAGEAVRLSGAREGAGVRLWAEAEGRLAMTAVAGLA
jgi:3-methylfumaryl-CoA hydratase